MKNGHARNDMCRERIAEAFLAACRLDVTSLKPGNVHVFAAGHRMQAHDFIESAKVAAPFIADQALTVGERVRRGVEATFAAVHCNTNLGILLLAAPLAAAAERGLGETGALTHQSLKNALATVLAGLTHDDAREVYRAIAHANPAGLGNAGEADVRAEPPKGLTLLGAMEMAAPHDLVARQYATGFDLVLEIAGSGYLPVVEAGLSDEIAMSSFFMQLLALQPDTHIARKHGPGAADDVAERAAEVLSGLRFTTPWEWSRPEVQDRLLAFDAALKAEGLNPGALADVMVAVAFVAHLVRQTEPAPAA